MLSAMQVRLSGAESLAGDLDSQLSLLTDAKQHMAHRITALEDKVAAAAAREVRGRGLLWVVISTHSCCAFVPITHVWQQQAACASLAVAGVLVLLAS